MNRRGVALWFLDRAIIWTFAISVWCLVQGAWMVTR